MALIFALFPACASAQDAPGYQASRWVSAASARVRLILPATISGGEGRGAVQIELPADSKTYWRNPGETGVPTIASFDGSTGLADLALEYPVPVAFDDGAGGISIGYTSGLAFPIRFKATGGAVKLAVALEFGVCTKTMCIPAQASLTLEPGAGQAAPELAEIIGKARAAVPLPRPPGAGEGIGIASAQRGADDGKVVLDVLARVTPGDSAPDLFVDAPDFYEVKRLDPAGSGTARFRVTSGSAPEAGKPLGDITLVLSSRGVATETKLNLDELPRRP